VKDNRPDEDMARNIISNEINNVQVNPSVIKQNGCVACHILFTLVDRLQLNEADASDLLTEVLSTDPNLNDNFIEMVENIHMKQRMMGVPFSIKTRQAKDRFIESNFKNFLFELSSDLVTYGTDVVIRKLLIASIALTIAQNIGIDYHAATEELYYYLRKNDQQTNDEIIKFLDNIYKKAKKT
jgi:hypothetical protein